MSKSILDRSELRPTGGENEPFKVGSRRIEICMINLSVAINRTKLAIDALLI